MNIFDIDSSGFIKGASKREKGSKRITARYTYYKKTTFGNHGNNILNIFNIDANGYVTKASKREKGSKRILSRYEYYPKTVYGKHGSNIKYQYTLNSNDTISSAILKEQHTKKIKSQYTFKSGTRYGNHWSNVIGVDLNVPIISQLPELPTGCEITAVTMMLQYAGANVNKVALAKAMPRHSWNPNAGYVGDPFTRNGWTIYPSALVSLVRKHVGSATDLTGKSIAGLETQLKNNKPVVVLVSPMHGFTVHAVTLTGFDQSNIYFNDPWTGKKNVKISKNEFNKIWNNQNKRALTY
ncbi:C39 family peptidase [Bacillus sp. PS06]|nr:C39 family peptidase [Bacillus sp. PS06]